MVKLNRIYTRTGDDGTTRLADSSRLAKSSARIEAIGAVDEANSALGLLAVSLAGHSARKAVASIQNDMFDLGADLATPGQNFEPSDMVLRIVPDQVTALEHAIDGLNVELPPLSSFVLPGGSEQAARAHVARAAVACTAMKVACASQEFSAACSASSVSSRLLTRPPSSSARQ